MKGTVDFRRKFLPGCGAEATNAKPAVLTEEKEALASAMLRLFFLLLDRSIIKQLPFRSVKSNDGVVVLSTPEMKDSIIF